MRIGFNNRVQILEDMVAHTQAAATRLLLASFSRQGSGTKIGPQFGVINSKRTRMNISLENLYVDIWAKKGYSLEDWGGLGQMEIDAVCQFPSPETKWGGGGE